MTMRILVDLLGYTGMRGGTETYVRELLPRLEAQMPGADFVGLVNRNGRERISTFFPGELRRVAWVGDGRASWAAGEIAAVDAAARRARTDLIWSPANFGPVVRSVARVVTIHDVIYHEIRGGRADRAVRGVTAWLMTRSATTADAVITVSHAAKRAIAKEIGVPAARIHVVHNGSSIPQPPVDPWQALAGVLAAPGRPIVLSTGNRMPHKNFEGLLKAVAGIDPMRRPLVVLPGAHGTDPLVAIAADLGLQDDVVLPGWVSATQLEALYGVADLYVCPSLAEGFAIPVVDALRRGCRVLANDIAVLREVGGDTAIYADATSPRHFARAIDDALNSPPNAVQSAAGVARANRFTWDTAAAATADVFRTAVQLRRDAA